MSDNSQKFIARNRAPRVQIEYDVELYGSEKKVQLPFVMGVMSDLSGKSKVEPPAVADRKFLEIDVDNFDERMKAMQPRAAFSVPNTLTGEGNLSVDLTFEKMDDFSPAAIAAKIEPLRALLEARTQLSNLMAYMDGKTGAETLIEKILNDPSLLAAVSGGAASAPDQQAALESLRDAMPVAEASDERGSALDSLRAAAPKEVAPEDTAGSVLDALREAAPSEAAPDTAADDALAALAGALVEDVPEDDGTSALDALRKVTPEEAAPDTAADDTLAALAGATVEEVPEGDGTSALDALRQVTPEEAAPDTAADEALAALASATVEEEPEDDGTSALDALRQVTPEEAAPDTAADEALAALASATVEEVPEDDGLDDLLGGFDETPETAEETAAPVEDDGLDDLLGSFDDAPATPEEAAASAEDDGLDDLLGGFDDTPEVAEETTASAEDDGLDDLLGGFDEAPQTAEKTAAPAEDDGLDDLLGGLDETPEAVEETVAPVEDDGLDNLLSGFDDAPGTPEEAAASAEDDGLDDLLGGFDDTPEAAKETAAAAEDDGLDDLLGDMPGKHEETAAPTEDDNLDDLLSGLAGDGAVLAEPEFAYGMMSSARPSAEALKRKRFRIALFGDFSGRAARGVIEPGDGLAERASILLDPDTVEEVIKSFGTTLVLPIGKDGAGVEVTLSELDDLHPDELYENVELFSELVGLRGELGMGATAESAAKRLRDWAETHGTYAAPPKARSGGSAVRADLKMSEFQKLIGDTGGHLTQASPIEDLMARVVGPHIRAVPDADAVAMQKAVDDALSAAMRLVLHHPDFQSLEAQWRSLDLIARSIEVDDTLDVVLYDVSAEEIAVDLAQADDLSQSGIVRLLTGEPLDEENGRGGYSAMFGLYSFEETPPHAELLGRIARVAAHVDAPFFAAMTPAFMEVDKKDRHPLVAEAWDTLREMSEAKYLGLVTPRFMLRRPYGAKSEPIYEFEFEEFTMKSGLGGMLWANPVVLVTILMAKSFKENGKSMGLGSIMSLGEIPYHFVTDRYGDQVQLPCTERNLTQDKVEKVMARGFMPVVSIKGRDEIRLTSFQSVGGGEILGPWSGETPPAPSPPKAVRAKRPAPAPAQADETVAAEADDLDSLLAGFDDLGGGDGDTGDVDADLAALLDDL